MLYIYFVLCEENIGRVIYICEFSCELAKFNSSHPCKNFSSTCVCILYKAQFVRFQHRKSNKAFSYTDIYRYTYI